MSGVGVGVGSAVMDVPLGLDVGVGVGRAAEIVVQVVPISWQFGVAAHVCWVFVLQFKSAVDGLVTELPELDVLHEARLVLRRKIAAIKDLLIFEKLKINPLTLMS